MSVKVVPRVDAARELAYTILRGLGDRLTHTDAVARRAGELAVTVPPEDRELLVVTAWLHDLGYGAAAHDTGFHALDGARYLRAHGWPDRVSALVAHHSGARFAAASLGLTDALSAFALEQSPLSDALTYADQTTGPAGQRMSITDRMAEMLARHGKDSVQARVHEVRGPFLLGVAMRVERRRAAYR